MTVQHAPPTPDAATLRAFAAELDALGRATHAKMGPEDIAYLERVDRTARWLTHAGRALIHFGFDPLTLGAGILAVAAGKQLNMIEICHAVLHGTYDDFDHPRLHSSRVRLDAPLTERGWHDTHKRHHPQCNVVGKDPDARFGVLRQNRLVPYRWHHRLQLLPLAANWIGLAGQLNLMVSGVADYHMRAPDDSYVLRDRSRRAIRAAHKRALAKAIPYYLKEFVLLPGLAGPFFPKVLLANLSAEILRNIYTAATVYSGHISEDTAVFPKETRPTSKGEWYWMQAVATTNFEVPRALSQLSGGLDQHIEHHFFPTLPPERIRQIAPEVRAICAKYGVPYKSAGWPVVLRSMLKQFVVMSRPPSPHAASA
jgi:fatty acid desaturase